MCGAIFQHSAQTLIYQINTQPSLLEKEKIVGNEACFPKLSLNQINFSPVKAFSVSVTISNRFSTIETNQDETGPSINGSVNMQKQTEALFSVLSSSIE